MQIKVLKTKYTQKTGEVAIKYMQRVDAEHGWDTVSLVSYEAPLPSLLIAMQQLTEDVLEICELYDAYEKGMRIIGVSVSYSGDDGAMGATITAAKALDGAPAPLIINTPHMPAEAEHGPCLGSETVGRIEQVQSEATRYVLGDRAQADIFADEQAA